MRIDSSRLPREALPAGRVQAGRREAHRGGEMPSAHRWMSAHVEPASAGDSYDALAETIDGLYKVEVIHRRGP